ncbi:hypothetical protein MKK50_11800 [Methylobacterium sp. J-043]|uniref:hypothetical protein n=1 Tax=Methylorubrum TaxID=2282523 RepID=UPI00209EDD9A|nr:MULTISPECIES: hypothetical protein [Methylorubrum]MCJ2030074.1 hypothetical protein [Methylobacterium sp. J-043]
MGFVSLKDWRARSAGLAQAASRAKALLHPAFGLSEADALSVNEIACPDPGCPDVETVVLVMRAGEPTRALRFRGPLDDLDEAAARALAAEEAGLRAL